MNSWTRVHTIQTCRNWTLSRNSESI